MIDKNKHTYLDYRERARALYNRHAVNADGVTTEHVHIPLHAAVQILEGGAFVEAVVWIPAATSSSQGEPR